MMKGGADGAFPIGTVAAKGAEFFDGALNFC